MYGRNVVDKCLISLFTMSFFRHFFCWVNCHFIVIFCLVYCLFPCFFVWKWCPIK